MPYGKIITFGTKALTIQTQNKNQYYTPYDNLDECFVNKIIDIEIFNLPVKFEIDYNNFAGFSNGNKRYYAKNIKIELIL